MDKGPKPSEMPYVVVTDGGGVHSGHPDEDTASAAARAANGRAEELGIATRYEVHSRA